MKRLFDIIFSIIGLILIFPVLLVCAILIKLNSKGPIFFKQIRIGRGGKPFKILKFRTMIRNAESTGPKITTKNDDRITSIGNILRWLKIDEIPQLINVLVGDMSFVGPRPEVPEIVKFYTEKQREVLKVKPGIIGANQILARNETDLYPDGIEDTEAYYIKHILPEKINIDLHYVKKSSFLYDMKLLLGGIIQIIIGAAQAHVFKEAKIPAFLLPIDMILICLSYFFAYALRYDWNIQHTDFRIFGITLPIVLLSRISIFLTYKVYRHIWKYVSINDLITIIKASILSSLIYIVLIFFLGLGSVSRSVFLIDLILILVFIAGIRISLRILTQRISIRERFEHINTIRKNIVIIGAGDVGEMALRELERNVKYRYTMVGFIDDDPQKFGKMIHGVKVLGTVKDISTLAKPYRIDEAFLAISRLSSDTIKSILKQCDEAGIKCRIVPAVVDSLNGKIYLNKVRDIEISDIFGRQPVELDFSGIGKFIAESTILITGAGGSIGSELSRQIAEYKPNVMILVDRNENYLHEIQCELENHYKSLPMYFIIADIKEEMKMEKIFTSFHPDIVFHAAAQKHVPLSEANMDEAVKNNIYGTQILAKLSNRYRTTHFVMISTDKAVNPTSVMGVTKRIAEKYIQSLSKNSCTKFVIVRFGNVMNSNGSVVPMFVKQIERGGPVTVTHPDIERFFMSIPEAVQLILQAVTVGRNGEIFILNMGNPVKILDLASELIKRAGLQPNRDIKIEFTGLRPGEKLFEELVGKEEEVLMTSHSQLKVIKSNNIMQINDFEQKISQLLSLVQDNDPSKLKEKFREIVPEYNSLETNILINEKNNELTEFITISKDKKADNSSEIANNSKGEEKIDNLNIDSDRDKIPFFNIVRTYT